MTSPKKATRGSEMNPNQNENFNLGPENNLIKKQSRQNILSVDFDSLYSN